VAGDFDMKRIAVALALFAGACSQAPDPRGVARDEVLLQVSATGQTEARPDEARLTVGVSTNAATAAAASAGNNAAMGRVTAGLERLGVKQDDLQTRSVTLSRIDYGPERGRYRADNLVEVRIRDLAQAGPAIAAATEAGGNVVAGPELRLSDPERADNAAYAAAYKAARARADAYAQAAGLRVVRVLGIRDAAADGPPIGYPRGAVGAAVEAQAAGPPVRAGISTREVRVRADFALAK
jgi:uncharacterized protein